MTWTTCTYTASGHWCGDGVIHATRPPRLTVEDARRAWHAYGAEWHAETGDTYYLVVMTDQSEMIDIVEIAP